MPVTVKITEQNGNSKEFKLPVEVWQRGPVWTFNVSSTSKITEVVLDPDKKLPDINRANNKMKEKPF